MKELYFGYLKQINMIGDISQSREVFNLKKLFIEAKLPENLQPLEVMGHNLWWSWDAEATELFKSIWPEKWEEANYNPLTIIRMLNSFQTKELSENKAFVGQVNRVFKRFLAYMDVPFNSAKPSVTYFSMEYGLHISLRLYSGGLGVLAGDFLKEASDEAVDMNAIGLLYRYGYFQQQISLHGDQISDYPPQKFTELPLTPVRDKQGEWLKISVELQDRTVFAKIWVLKVGRINLFLLDADIDENAWEDRSLTHQLYGGDNEHRLKQEILLGIGGVKALKAMGIESDIYHCNEGHAAFMGLERIRSIMHWERLDFSTALEMVRASSLFTTHTPVPAGHDHFSTALMHQYFYHYIGELGLSMEQFMALGKIQSDNVEEDFSMSHLAIRISKQVNGVSKLHGQVSREMFDVLYPGYIAEEVHIGHVTNSVHYPTWIAEPLDNLYRNYFGKDFLEDQSNPERWGKIMEVNDRQLYEIRTTLKRRLLVKIEEKLKEDLLKRGEHPSAIFKTIKGIQPDALVVGFARRFATYKRAHLLFSDLDRLAQLVNHPERPVLFLFSGKAHPADKGGQALIKHIIEVSRKPEFLGKVIFLEGYNMELAKYLVQGVDVWLNTPTRPLEASGTSGMKAALNGVVNFSVLDGWWAEGYRPDAGWALQLERTYKDQSLQDQLDAENLYNIFETEIVPTYFDKNEDGVPVQWVSYVKHIIADVAPRFTMKRMMDDYFEYFYQPLKSNYQALCEQENTINDFVQWKKDIQEKWEGLRRTDIRLMDTENESLVLGEPFDATLEIYLNGMAAQDIGLEVVLFRRIDEHKLELKTAQPMQLKEVGQGTAIFSCKYVPEYAGVLEYGFRVFPQHPLLAHRQDVPLVKWV
jgi:starch phosphorylase